jgi:hypothetical protein
VHLQRLQVLVHIYTRVQEELEKKAKPAGTEFDCFTSTNVQILTHEELRAVGLLHKPRLLALLVHKYKY